MVKIFCGKQNEANTNYLLEHMWIMALEYDMEEIFSVKSDDFNFGVVLLEIISGKKNIGFHVSKQSESLPTYAWKLWCEGNASELMDPIMAQSCVVELLKFIRIGLLCIQEDSMDTDLPYHPYVLC
ncbi:hypothetical protein Pint_11831 [Pistacia integerrima]|uniref:Uncharacterized protein n=1 Tax=Pistacia integerrima TaxID=434235 RepID=A0ACC0XKN6_9ROSI|nr:hypothetical protein Pint_11831 [Pistacia integerrima]